MHIERVTDGTSTQLITITHGGLRGHLIKTADYYEMPSYSAIWTVTDGHGGYVISADEGETVPISELLTFLRAFNNEIDALHSNGCLIFANVASGDSREKSRKKLYSHVGFMIAPEGSGYELWYVG